MNTINISEEDFINCIETMVLMETMRIILNEKGIKDADKIKVMQRLMDSKKAMT